MRRTWQLEVHDDLPGNSGTILGVELLLTVAEPCGPRAEVKGAVRIGESCEVGGTGDGNGLWDNGEVGAVRLTLANTGQELLTGVRATLTPTTPGVTMLDDVADFPDMPRNALLDSPEPHFTALLPVGIACATRVGFNVSIQTDQGNYTGTIETGQAGESIPSSTATELTEAFASGIPSNWEIEDKRTGGGAASIDITNEASGADDVVITFRYNGGANSRWWIVDNIRVTYVYPASCQLVDCASTTRPSEVRRLHWNSPTSMVWSPASNATQYTLYRGVENDLSRLSNSTIDSCTRVSRSATALGNLADKPAAGRLHWWLIRAANGTQLGSAGFMTSGLRQQESSGSCPQTRSLRFAAKGA